MSWQTVISHALAFALGFVAGYAFAGALVRRFLKEHGSRRRAPKAKE